MHIKPSTGGGAGEHAMACGGGASQRGCTQGDDETRRHNAVRGRLLFPRPGGAAGRELVRQRLRAHDARHQSAMAGFQ